MQLVWKWTSEMKLIIIFFLKAFHVPWINHRVINTFVVCKREICVFGNGILLLSTNTKLYCLVLYILLELRVGKFKKYTSGWMVQVFVFWPWDPDFKSHMVILSRCWLLDNISLERWYQCEALLWNTLKPSCGLT